MRSTILCVDDDKWLLATLSEQLTQWLGDKYQIEKALSASEGLEIIEDCMEDDSPISLVISDYIMPGMKGDEFLEQVKMKIPMTRRIMLTGYSAVEGIKNAINKAGIYRYLTKPWEKNDMMMTVLHAIRSYEQDNQTEKLNKKNAEMYGMLEKMNAAMQTNFRQAIETLAVAAETRDGQNMGHAKRVAEHAIRFGVHMGLSGEELKTLQFSALMHDIGKVGLSDAELEAARNLKQYTDSDAAHIQSEKAEEILKGMEGRFLPGVMYHAERVDGQGAYGMDQDSIPLEAKIIGMCDYYDTLKHVQGSDSAVETLSVMGTYSGKIFDKMLLEKFLKFVLK